MEINQLISQVALRQGAYLVSGVSAGWSWQALQNAFSQKFGDNLRTYPQDISQKIKIEQVRAIERLTFLAPLTGKLSIILIYARCLTHPAQVALLKTLEELPAHMRAVIAVGERNDVLPTIKSRCTRCNLHFKKEDNKILASSTSLQELLGQPLPDKIKAVASLVKRDNLPQIIDNWMLERRYSNDNVKVLQELFELKKRLSQNVNKRLALDYFLFVLDK